MGPDVEYASNAPLADLLLTVKRPGDFCAHGRMFLPMPTLEVEGVGLLSFPVAASQVGALVEAAERSPYGKGPRTLVDTSVRDCWQIDAARLRVGGQAWAETLATIMDRAAAGIGCRAESLDARLYKLLVYPTGGFFAPHRDTEKSEGMVATLTISLPTDGTGGELVVRHQEREVTVPLGAAEPSELAFAAFYADCAHETRPVRTGHRLSLVYNLCVLPEDADTPRVAPDYSAEIEAVSDCLTEWRDESVADKLVWVLEHDYSTAGLSFDTLKNADGAVAGVLKTAANRADCVVHAAIVHIEEEGDALYPDGDYVDSWHWPDESDVEHVDMNELYDSRHWLDGWVGRDGDRPAFGEVPLLPEEMLPADALADALPDEQRVHEASGNEGVTLERTYQRAALVIWPRWKTLDVATSAGLNVAVEWLTAQLETSGASRERGLALAGRLVGMWRHDEYEREEQATSSRVRMLDLLTMTGDAALTLRFLREVTLRYYSRDENRSLLCALETIGEEASGRYLPDFVRAHFARMSDQTLALLRGVDDAANVLRRSALGTSVRQAVAELPDALDAGRSSNDWSSAKRRRVIGVAGIRDLFVLAWRCGVIDAASSAAAGMSEHPEAVAPDRAIPAALAEMRSEAGLVETAAYAGLWRHAADFLLARSATPPAEPQNWAITCDIDCNCDLCAKLRAFCQDPVARTERFPVRKDLRKHLHNAIDANRLDMFHETERRGRPFTLVCTKNRASHERRLAEYAEDVEWMRSLADFGPGGEWAAACEDQLARLHHGVRADDG